MCKLSIWFSLESDHQYIPEAACNFTTSELILPETDSSDLEEKVINNGIPPLQPLAWVELSVCETTIMRMVPFYYVYYTGSLSGGKESCILSLTIRQGKLIWLLDKKK